MYPSVTLLVQLFDRLFDYNQSYYGEYITVADTVCKRLTDKTLRFAQPLGFRADGWYSCFCVLCGNGPQKAICRRIIGRKEGKTPLLPRNWCMEHHSLVPLRLFQVLPRIADGVRCLICEWECVREGVCVGCEVELVSDLH